MPILAHQFTTHSLFHLKTFQLRQKTNAHTRVLYTYTLKPSKYTLNNKHLNNANY